MAAISGFGQDGPYHKRPGFDQIAQGMGGLMSITGRPRRGPMRVGIPVADLTAGLFCAMGILTALLERDVSGEGQWLQTSLLQAQIFMLDFQASRWLMEKDVAKQVGNDHPTSIPPGVFKTSDGYINIATAGGKIWERCAPALGRARLPKRPEYATAPTAPRTARPSMRRSTNSLKRSRPIPGSPSSMPPACRAGRFIRSTRCSTTSRSSISAIAQDVPNAENRHIRLVGQPFNCHARPARWRQHRRNLASSR